MALDALALDFSICLETPDLDQRILALTDHAFGPGRYVKTAERLREGAHILPDMSFVALDGDRLLGSVRMWPIDVREGEACERIAFLGPIVVDDACRGRGVGKALIHACLEAAFAKGLRAVLLVGTPGYFLPFGFEKAKDITLPGPVDPNRLMIHYSQPGLAFTGRVSKAV
ncbi:MAG: N-acetyltransferase [Asticcacaulis sp.]|uniref:GNAT family N-acetyltransferase n=1 Tax=Asticcacaulis sp. TaxID=1872648 RepID=UPI0039E2EF08